MYTMLSHGQDNKSMIFFVDEHFIILLSLFLFVEWFCFNPALTSVDMLESLRISKV